MCRWSLPGTNVSFLQFTVAVAEETPAVVDSAKIIDQPETTDVSADEEQASEDLTEADEQETEDDETTEADEEETEADEDKAEADEENDDKKTEEDEGIVTRSIQSLSNTKLEIWCSSRLAYRFVSVFLLLSFSSMHADDTSLTCEDVFNTVSMLILQTLTWLKAS